MLAYCCSTIKHCRTTIRKDSPGSSRGSSNNTDPRNYETKSSDSIRGTSTSKSDYWADAAAVSFQLFADHVARLKDHPIDKPRNLAKSVTVE
jgi:glucosamine 6-phosphate synthetase-like amidotransferase/phosphosugar isomerase protein